MKREEKNFSVRLMARVLGVCSQGYYRWKNTVNLKEANDRALKDKRVLLHARSRKTYGSSRIEKNLREKGLVVNHKRVERLMREEGLRAKACKKFKATTNSSHCYPVAENLLRRDFYAATPDTKWVSNITYVHTDEGWLYLCVVLDLFSRKVIGWSMKKNMSASAGKSCSLNGNRETRYPSRTSLSLR